MSELKGIKTDDDIINLVNQLKSLVDLRNQMFIVDQYEKIMTETICQGLDAIKIYIQVR